MSGLVKSVRVAVTGECGLAWTPDRPSLHFQVSGRGDSVVLVHEIGGSLWSWSKVASRLSSRFSVLVYDQRGAGLSEKPRGEFDLAALVEDLRRVIVASGLPGPFRLAGGAAGAAVALGYAVLYPDQVVAVALCAPAVQLDPTARQHARERAERVAKDGMAGIIDAAVERLYPAALRGTEFPEYRSRFLAHDPVMFGALNCALAGADIEIAKVRSPCLVVAGRQDIRSVDQMQTLADEIVGARMTILEQAGHVMANQAPDALAEVLDNFFLRPA